jgi:hypothetical protein
MISQRQTAWLVLIGMIAFILRLAPLARGDLTFQTGWDAADYIPLARGIQHGCGFARFVDGHCGIADVSRPPGYPFFLALMPGLRTALVIQAFLGAALCVWLGYFISTHWGMGPGLMGAVLLATDIPSIVYGGMIMSEALFQFLLTGAILLEMSAIIADDSSTRTNSKALAAAGMLAVAAMIRPTGLLLPLFAAIPFLWIRRTTWRRALALGLLAFALPAVAMLAWTVRNERVAGLSAPSSDSVVTIFYYNAAGVLAYGKHISFEEAASELAYEIGWRGPPLPMPDKPTREMMLKSFKIFREYPLAALIVTVRGLLLVATVPDRNELNDLLGTNGGGPLGLAPSFNILTRIRRTMKSPTLAILVMLQVLVNLFVWVGVARGLLHTDWKSKIDAVCMLLPLAVALAMLACAASPAAHARFRVPAVPFLAMLAGIGWLGSRSNALVTAPVSRDETMALTSMTLRI